MIGGDHRTWHEGCAKKHVYLVLKNGDWRKVRCDDKQQERHRKRRMTITLANNTWSEVISGHGMKNFWRSGKNCLINDVLCIQSFTCGLAKYSLHLFVERKIKQFTEEASMGLAARTSVLLCTSLKADKPVHIFFRATLSSSISNWYRKGN